MTKIQHTTTVGTIYKQLCYLLAPRIAKIPTWSVYMLGIGWAIWMFWLGATQRLGANPIETLLHAYGEKALQLLIIILAMRPIQRLFFPISLIRFRRAIGVLSFLFMVMHLLVWAILDVQSLTYILEDIQKRPYITIGFAAFVVAIPLAITSNNLSVRRLGIKWLMLHRLTYPLALLASIHFVWLAKGWQVQPLLYLTIILALLAWRIVSRNRYSRSPLTKKRTTAFKKNIAHSNFVPVSNKVE